MQVQMENELMNPTHFARSRRLKALIIKEFLQIVRDPSSIIISVFFPILLLFLYGYGVSLDMNHLRIGLVLEDTAPDAQSFANALIGSRFFDVKIARHREAFSEDIVRGNIRGIVVVPAYFSEFRYRNSSTAPIQVIADGSEPNTAAFVQNYVSAAWQNWLRQESVSSGLRGLPMIDTQPRFWFNEELESRYFLIPGSLAITMTLIGTLLTALVVAREWERGTMEALMATPVTIFEILIAKLIPYFILGMGSMLISTAFAIFVYGIPFRGSLLVLMFVTGAFLFTALSIGLLISTLSRNQFVASQAAIVASFLPAFILSGFIFEISSMPIIIRAITYFIPARYFVSSLQTLFLAGNVWHLLIINVLFMLTFGSILFLITARKTVKRLD